MQRIRFWPIMLSSCVAIVWLACAPLPATAVTPDPQAKVYAPSTGKAA
jgi:hypothetical protein